METSRKKRMKSGHTLRKFRPCLVHPNIVLLLETSTMTLIVSWSSDHKNDVVLNFWLITIPETHTGKGNVRTELSIHWYDF